LKLQTDLIKINKKKVGVHLVPPLYKEQLKVETEAVIEHDEHLTFLQ